MKKTVLFFAWAVLLFSALVVIFSVSGCRVGRRNEVVKLQLIKADTSRVKTDSIAVKQLDDFFISHIEKDTAVGIGGNEISAEWMNEADAPGDTTIKKGNVSLHIYHDIKGRRHIICKSDSLTLVIARLVRDSIHQSHTNDSVYVSVRQLTAKGSLETSSSERIVKRTPGSLVLLQWLFAAFLGAVFWEVVRRRLTLSV